MQDLLTQESFERYGNLTASLEVVCQALIDSKQLGVHLELGLKLSWPPTWMELTTLLLRSIEMTPTDPGPNRLSRDDISEVSLPAP
jgi:hypothetical protein